MVDASPKGVHVLGTIPGSPAAKAGINILRFSNTAVLRWIDNRLRYCGGVQIGPNFSIAW